MNMVFLAPESVFPANTGGRIVVYNKIKYLSKKGYNIYLYCVVDSDDEIRLLTDEMNKYCCEVRCYNRNATRLRSFLYFIRYPYAIASRTNDRIKEDIQQLLDNGNIDVVWCEMPQMSLNLKGLRIGDNTKVILSQQNVEYKSMFSVSNAFRNPLKKSIYRFDAVRFEKYEKKIYRNERIDAYAFVSQDDIRLFRKHFGVKNKPLALFPIGADEHESFIRDTNTHNVLIVGKMSYPPNVDGVMWFYNKVWPLVVHKVKDAHLYIVGKDPDERILEIADDNITVTGTVESVEDYYKIGAVAAIPLFCGGGVKTKLIEAVSYGIPVVCTKPGAKGTVFDHKKHMWISDDPEDFAFGVIEALNCTSGAYKMVESAKNIFNDKYTWKGIVDQIDLFVRKLSN